MIVLMNESIACMHACVFKSKTRKFFMVIAHIVRMWRLKTEIEMETEMGMFIDMRFCGQGSSKKKKKTFRTRLDERE